MTWEDILSPTKLQLDKDAVLRCIKGRTVLVTGAGGSIGSELCKQIATYEPDKLIMMGHGENSIYQLSEIMGRNDAYKYVVGSTTHLPTLRALFDSRVPDIVFHVAAHKHVPMMEMNELAAAHGNVIGTWHLTRTCDAYGVGKVVLISTDKAAEPCSVMGATKWLCEEIFQTVAECSERSSYVTVRFGNILGSRGSVVPLFEKQIRNGGPLTITHEDMTRYFIRAPDAVKSVLQSMATGENGGVYMLDMGDPLKIVTLAKAMIGDLPIQLHFVGSRPGERLHEQLISRNEQLLSTACPGLLSVVKPITNTSYIYSLVYELMDAIDVSDTDKVHDLLQEAMREATAKH